MKNKKNILPIAFGAALVGTLVYFLYKSIKAPQIQISEGTGNGTTPTPPTPTPKKTYVTTRSGTRLRLEPNTVAFILKTYESGYEMLVLGSSSQSDGTWFQVQDPQTMQTGFMRSDVVNIPYEK